MDEEEAITILSQRIDELEEEGAWGSLIDLGSVLIDLSDKVAQAARKVAGS